MEKASLQQYIDINILNPLLTDFYQFSMIYAHWKNGRHKEHAVFDLYFRKNPFNLDVFYAVIISFLYSEELTSV
jgi:nicotinic acid phosphoribosyltransferase